MKVQSWLANSKKMSYLSSNSSNKSTRSTTTLSPSSDENSTTPSSFLINAAEISTSISAPFHVSCNIATINTPTTQMISCLAVHQDNNILYAASNNTIINVYDLENNYSHIDSLSCGNSNSNSSSGLIKSIAFDGNKIYTAHQDCKIRVWQPKSNVDQCRGHRLVSTMPTVKDRLRRGILPRNYVQVRRQSNKQMKKLWIEHLDTISGLALSNGLVYSVSWDKCLKIWRMSDLTCLQSIKAHSDAINAVIASADEGGVVYTASADGEIKVWGKTILEESKKNGLTKHGSVLLIASLEKHSTNINALALSSDGMLLFSGGSDKTILVWEKEDENMHYMSVLRLSLSGHTSAILCLSYVHSNDLLISGSSDTTIRVWQRENMVGGYGYSCAAVYKGHSKPVKCIAVLANQETEEEGEGGSGGVSIFSGSTDGEIKVWQLVR